jgi:diadenosine tetraphosphatase ApaH/serine/threonine PP2A family protein phosphatase
MQGLNPAALKFNDAIVAVRSSSQRQLQWCSSLQLWRCAMRVTVLVTNMWTDITGLHKLQESLSNQPSQAVLNEVRSIVHEAGRVAPEHESNQMAKIGELGSKWSHCPCVVPCEAVGGSYSLWPWASLRCVSNPPFNFPRAGGGGGDPVCDSLDDLVRCVASSDQQQDSFDLR